MLEIRRRTVAPCRIAMRRFGLEEATHPSNRCRPDPASRQVGTVQFVDSRTFSPSSLASLGSAQNARGAGLLMPGSRALDGKAFGFPREDAALEKRDGRALIGHALCQL